jgi:hypothetical protein
MINIDGLMGRKIKYTDSRLGGGEKGIVVGGYYTEKNGLVLLIMFDDGYVLDVPFEKKTWQLVVEK